MRRSAEKPDDYVGSYRNPTGLTGEAAVPAFGRPPTPIGLDIVNEGEYTKGGDWLSFADDRFGGFTDGQPKPGPPLVTAAKIARSSPLSTSGPPSAARSSSSPAIRFREYGST